MKRKKLFIPVTVFALLLSVGLGACGGNSNNNEGGGGDSSGAPASNSTSAQQPRITVTAAESKNKLLKDETVQLTAKVGDEVLEGVSWESSKPEIATVSNAGLVTAIAKGSTSITASKDGYRAGSLSITVDLPSITVTAQDNKTSLLKGETVALTASEQGVAWASSSDAIASVNNAGVVTANAIGSATISASKDGFNAGNITINVVRPEPTGTLHFEDAEHYTSDGTWGTSYNGSMYGPGDESPVYSRSSGNASGGTCIAYMDNGDTETLTFTSSAAVKAELVMTMASRNAVNDMSTVMDVTLNGAAIDLAGKSFEGGGDTNTFVEFSLGEFNLQTNNVLAFEFKASSPYFDDLNIYAESPVTIEVVRPVEKDPVTINQESITVEEGKTAAITSSMTDLSFKSNNTAIATVDANGVVTGVKAGETTISVSKTGYKTIKVPVTVTEVAGTIVVPIQNGTGTGVTTRESQNITGDNKYIIDEFPAGAVYTLNFTVENAGTYTLMMRCRASGGYNSSTTDDLSACMTLKVNNEPLTLSGTVSGSSFTDYLLGEVTLAAGPASIEITCVTAVPTINLFRLLPKA